MWCALSWFFIHYYQSTWRFPRGPSFIKSPRKKSVSSVITSAWYLWGQGTDHPGKLMHRESSNFSSDSELGITMQEWESGIRIESAMKIPNHCSATVKKQKQLQGITGNGAQGWNHYCQHFNSQHKRTGRKGKKDDNIYERQLNTKTLPPAQGSTKLWITGNQVSFWSKSEQLPCSSTFVLFISHEDTILAKRTSAWPGEFCHFFSLIFFSRAGALKIALQLQMKAKIAVIP